MSIFASLPAPHSEDGNAPLVYEGSHVYPNHGIRVVDGGFDLAMIPAHVERDGDGMPSHDDDGPPHPYLRFSLTADGEGASVILTEAQAKELCDSLAWWLRARKVGIHKMEAAQ